MLEALDEHTAFVVHREVHRAHHPLAPALAQPARRGIEQSAERLAVLLDLEKAEHPPGVVVKGVEVRIDVRADAPHDAVLAAGQEQLCLSMGEKGVVTRA